MLPSAVTAQKVREREWRATIRRARERERGETECILRSTCSTILPLPSSMHIQLRCKVQPASDCLQLASIMDGFVCMCVCVCVCVCSEGMSRGRRGGGGGSTVNESSIPQKCFHHTLLSLDPSPLRYSAFRSLAVVLFSAAVLNYMDKCAQPVRILLPPFALSFLVQALYFH